jgi:prepilin-type N-terminal cleavage/methylation domain-containing protein
MKRRSFTLVELMVVIAIIGILGTIVAPAVGDAIIKARVAKVVALAHTLETACDNYFGDTNTYAREYGSNSYIDPGYHNLFYNPGIATWSGPYIKKPLQSLDNPFAPTSFTYLYANLASTGTCVPAGGGFDLNGDGVNDRTGAGNFFCVDFVPESVAQRIDRVFDAGIPGDWKTTGRVQFQPDSTYGNIVNIYLGGGS